MITLTSLYRNFISILLISVSTTVLAEDNNQPVDSQQTTPKQVVEAVTSQPTEQVNTPRVEETDILKGIIEDYSYDPTGKRDPFVPDSTQQVIKVLTGNRQGPVLPLQRFDLEQIKVVGIIWDVENPKAMITDPTGAGHIIQKQARVGRNNGYVHEIREGEIIVVEPSVKDGQLNYVMKVIKIHK